MAALTGGEVPRTTNIESLKTWLVAQGIDYKTNDAPTVPMHKELRAMVFTEADKDGERYRYDRRLFPR